jgi:pimeloyl-ACP methyl ester carboxylesterase
VVSRLRSRIGPGLVGTSPGGYRLAAPDDEVDASLFEGLVDEAARSAPEEAAALLGRADALWRGPAYTAYDDLPGVREAAARLTELRSVARERRGRALLELERYDDAVAHLESLVVAEPYRESAVAVLVTALARSGRAAEALGRIADLRTLLRDSGLDPSPELEHLQLRILGGELAPTAGPDAWPMLPLRVRVLTRSDGEKVTYGEAGSGPTLVFTPGWVSRLDALSDGLDPRGRVLARLAERFRVVAYDRFGTGLSPGRVAGYGLPESVAELRDVLTATGSSGVVLFASSAAAPIAVAAAADDPRVERLVLLGGYADGPQVFHNAEVRSAMFALVASSWGMGSRVLANLLMPDRYEELEFARFQRQAASAEVAAGFLQQMYDADVSGALSRVRQPTLVLHYADDPAVPLSGGRRLAAGIPGARLVVLDGASHLPPVRDTALVADEIVAFCLGDDG